LTESEALADSVRERPVPVLSADRIDSLDFMRGIAVLGILVINIQFFSMPDPAGFNPTVYGDLTGINYAVWYVSHIFFEMKFMSIFSILFGAGIFLLTDRLEQRDVRPARIHYRRTLWLLLFGLIHGFLLWYGDILVWYSFTAFLAYLFRRMRPGWLIFWSLLLMLFGTALYVLFQWSLPFWPPEAHEGVAAYWSPTAEMIGERIDAYRGGWLAQMSERVFMAAILDTFAYLVMGLWRTLSMMLLGMVLMKWRVLAAERSNRFYVIVLVAGAVIALPVIMYGVTQNFAHDWSYKYTMYIGSQYNYWGSLALALAYISAAMLMCRNSFFPKVRRLLSSVGRMAFSCYILQTLICITLFYGHGFGLYGQVPRWGQALVVIGIWAALVILCRAWLSHYRFGPLEWVWRSLTYRKRQPMRLL
jgi:uncharacterized protein